MEKIQIAYRKNNVELDINLVENTLIDNVPNVDAVRYLKGIFTNRERFISRFTDECNSVRSIIETQLANGELDDFDNVNPMEFDCSDFMNELIEIYDTVKPFSYEEAFKIENLEFQAKVFGSINITEMISHLGNKRIKTEGKMVKHKTFDIHGNFTGYKEYNNIYETYEVNGSKLGLNEPIYAIKCWCTTTENEHWLWIDEKYKDQPLEGIASTFMVHESLVPHIKELKRQGDILLVELNEGCENIEAEGEMVSLTSDQYFNLLTAQS